MLRKLRETASRFNTWPHLTFVVSETQMLVDFPAKDHSNGIFAFLNDESHADMGSRYPVSKLLQVFGVREMCALRPADSYHVNTNMVNPGLCESELGRNGNLTVKVLKFLLARTTEQGSRTFVHGASTGPNQYPW